MRKSVVVILLILFACWNCAASEILVGGAGHTGIQRFDAATGAWLGPLIATGEHGYNGTSGMVIGPDQRLYVTNFNKIWQFDLAANEFVEVFASLDPIGNYFNDVMFGPDGHLYATNTNAGTVTRFNGQTGHWMGDFISGVGENVQDLAFSPDGDLLVTDGPTGTWRYDGRDRRIVGQGRGWRQ